MEARSADYEIVHVISDFRLLDEESYERVYWRRDGKPLTLGYYVVTWGPGTLRRKFDESAEFRGPYRQEAEARMAARQLFGGPVKHPPAREHDVPALEYLRPRGRHAGDEVVTLGAHPRAPRQLVP